MNREILYDDEPILRFNSQEEDADVELDGGTTEARIFNKRDAPLEKCPFKVLLELKGGGAVEGRLGVDLVTVLDISRSMITQSESEKNRNEATKLAKMKVAMRFLVQKLSRVDRLSVVTFNKKADKLCPLRQITETSQREIVDQINDLEATSTTNTEAALRMALDILNDRKLFKRRNVAIMLMSDGIEDEDISDAISVPVSAVPVYTFAYGIADGCDHHEVLKGIAKNSKGGTFSPVPDLNGLTVAFSTALAGLLNVAIEDLTLTVQPLNMSELNEVNTGNYPKTPKQATVMEPVTVTFKSLYHRETRKVLAKLTLPKVDERMGVNIYQLVYKYRVSGKDEFDSDERFINVSRTAKPIDGERPEVLAEDRRIRTASSIREARILADKKQLDKAREELKAAGKSLAEIDVILKAQVEHLILLMVSEETYEEQGRAFALALEAAHESQRATALPGGVPTMFETPLMGEFKKQAEAHTLDPDNYQVPTAEEDSIATAPPTLQVDQSIIDLAYRLAETLKQLNAQAANLQVDRTKVQDFLDLSESLAGKLKELDSQAPASSN